MVSFNILHDETSSYRKNFPNPCVFSIPLAGDAVLAARLCKLLIVEKCMATASNVLCISLCLSFF